MSIELDNPKTTYERVDAAANFVMQMRLAHQIKDERTFIMAHKRASELLAEALEEIDGLEL